MTKTKKMTTYQMATAALMAAVMCILGPMSVPIGPVPISLTNLVIYFALYLIGSKYGTVSYLVYLLLGAVGLPVFSGFTGGFAKLAGPTGGYLIGFIPMAIIGGLMIEKSHGKKLPSILGMVLVRWWTIFWHPLVCGSDEVRVLVCTHRLCDSIPDRGWHQDCSCGGVWLPAAGTVGSGGAAQGAGAKAYRGGSQMTLTERFEQRVVAGEILSRDDALKLAGQPLEPLCAAADRIRAHFCGNRFDLCTIINAKSGNCSENCKFCAQSARYATGAQSYPMLPKETIVAKAVSDARRGVLRFSLVTSGRCLTDVEVDEACEAIREIRRTADIRICVSMGLLSKAQYARLKAAGVDRVHNNLEASPQYFPRVCTTHTTEDKIAAIRAAREAGLCVCSGGILGLGENMADRIDLALAVRELG